MSLFDNGDHAWKGAIHGATLVLAVEMMAYHLVVCRRARGRVWHRFSACAYAGLTVLEAVQIYRHVARQSPRMGLMDVRALAEE